MRTNDSNTLLQATLRNFSGIIGATGVQYSGIYYGVVAQTDATVSNQSPPPITAGNLTITIPSLSGASQVWGPLPYPGAFAPPAGTRCSVGFNHNNQPVILAFYGFTPGMMHYGSGYPSPSLGNVGDNYIDVQGTVYNGEVIIHQGPNIYGPKTHNGWGSPTPIA